MNHKYTHLRGFPLEYEISTNGIVRKRGRNGFTHFSTIDEPQGTFVFININDKLQKCLLAELVLLSFSGTYVLGDKIKYRDGNIHNVCLTNLKHQKIKPVFSNYNTDGKWNRWKGIWRVQSRADGANARCAKQGLLITADDVLRVLIITDFKCFYCQSGLNPFTWHLDHYMPVSKGGPNHFNNLRPSCKYCNTMKSNMEYGEWASKMHRILQVFIKYNPDHTFNSENFNVHSEPEPIRIGNTKSL